jgi:hypothetical protein
MAHFPHPERSPGKDYARVVAMPIYAYAISPGQENREACQASRPPRSLGHPSCRHLLLSSVAGPFLGTVAAALANRAFYSFFRPRQSPFLDRCTRARPSVANRCRSQRRSRTHYFRALSLRAPSHLHIDARSYTRHRLPHHPVVAASSFPLALRHRHGDPRAR